MVPYKSGFYYFNIDDLDHYISINIELLISNNILANFNNTYIYGLNIGKNMDINISFGRYSSTIKEEVIVFIFGFLRGIEENDKYRKYLYSKSLEYREKSFNDFFSKCSILEN
jgi:hypothetical protein